MTTYYSKSEIQAKLKSLVEKYVKNCIEGDKLSDDFMDLLKHNFLAKYVSYNINKRTIEIGIEDVNSYASTYPVINVMSFPVSVTGNSWLEKSFRNQMNDLIFYGNLLNRSKYNQENSEVVII